MKISCAINSKNPDLKLLRQCIESASMFDEIVLYLDGSECKSSETDETEMRMVGDGKQRSIVEGFNYVVGKTTGEWVCAFCDDDFFHAENMRECLDRIRAGYYDDADVVYSKVFINSGEWGETSVDYGTLRQRNQIPHGSIFRKSTFLELGGYRTEFYSDWNLWLRFAKAGKQFRYFEKPTYYFRYKRKGSATERQLNKYGGHARMRQMVLEDVDRS